MARSRTRKAKSRVLSLDFSNAEVRKLAGEGPQPAEIVEVTEEEGQKGTYLAWKFKVIEGEDEGAVVYDNTSLVEDALWRLRGLLMSAGMDIPQDAVDIDLDEVIGAKLTLHIQHEDYEGKTKARVQDYSEYVEEDKPASRKRGKKVEEEEEEEDEKPARRSRGKAKVEEEEDEKPARGKAGASKAGAGKSKKKQGVSEDEVGDMDSDELAELVEEFDLEVDLESIKSLRRMRTAVIEALRDAELLTED